jgi:hypothetical protein
MKVIISEEEQFLFSLPETITLQELSSLSLKLERILKLYSKETSFLFPEKKSTIVQRKSTRIRNEDKKRIYKEYFRLPENKRNDFILKEGLNPSRIKKNFAYWKFDAKKRGEKFP